MTQEDPEFAKKITTYLNRGTQSSSRARPISCNSRGARRLARLADPERATQSQLALAGAGAGSTAGRASGRESALAIGSASCSCPGVFWLPAMAGVSAIARHRGDGRRDPVLGPADRCVPGPGIPELAEARIRRRLIRILAFSLALAAAAAGSAFAQPVALRSPAWSELPAGEQQIARADRARVGQARRAAQAEMAFPRAALPEDDRRRAAAHPAADGRVGAALAAAAGGRA